MQFVRGEGDPAVAGENANHAYDEPGPGPPVLQGEAGPELDRQRRAQPGRQRQLRCRASTTPSGTACAWSSATATASIFKDFTGDIDVPGHELTHGVTQYTAGLNYTNDQTGALNESFSDMMGSAIDAWANNRDADTPQLAHR